MPQDHRVAAELGDPGLERHAGAGRRLLEDQRHRALAQCVRAVAAPPSARARGRSAPRSSSARELVPGDEVARQARVYVGRVAMRVLTWNLLHGRSVPAAGRDLFDEFADALAGWEWDVALLQEVPPWWPSPLGARLEADDAARADLAQRAAAGAARGSDAVARSDQVERRRRQRDPRPGRRGRRAPRRRLCLWPERRWVHGVRLHGAGVWVGEPARTARPRSACGTRGRQRPALGRRVAGGARRRLQHPRAGARRVRVGGWPRRGPRVRVAWLFRPVRRPTCSSGAGCPITPRCFAERGRSEIRTRRYIDISAPAIPRAAGLTRALRRSDARPRRARRSRRAPCRSSPLSNGGCGSYSIPSWIACATCSPAIRAASVSAMSIPDDTPAAVITLPCSHDAAVDRESRRARGARRAPASAWSPRARRGSPRPRAAARPCTPRSSTAMSRGRCAARRASDSSCISARVPYPPGTTITSGSGSSFSARSAVTASIAVSVRFGPRSAAMKCNRGSGQPRQHFVGADRVERGEPVEDRDRDVHLTPGCPVGPQSEPAQHQQRLLPEVPRAGRMPSCVATSYRSKKPRTRSSRSCFDLAVEDRVHDHEPVGRRQAVERAPDGSRAPCTARPRTARRSTGRRSAPSARRGMPPTAARRGSGAGRVPSSGSLVSGSS